MLNTDARAAALIAWLDDLEEDHRLPAGDRDFLGVYRVKIASMPTSYDYDNRMLMILRKFFTLSIIKNRT